jgi:hypothetical protein
MQWQIMPMDSLTVNARSTVRSDPRKSAPVDFCPNRRVHWGVSTFGWRAVPGSIRRGAEFRHALGASQHLEFQGFVLHGQFMAAFALTIQPLENLRRQTESTTKEATGRKTGVGSLVRQKGRSLGDRTPESASVALTAA